MRVEHHYCGGFIVGRRLVWSDWDYPATARDLGWSLARVQRVGKEVRHLARRSKRCEHRGTDGTIDCPDCGVKAIEFINAAAEFLSSKC